MLFSMLHRSFQSTSTKREGGLRRRSLRRLLIEPLEGRRLLAGDVLNLSTLGGTNGFRLDGVAAFDNSGFRLSSAGDVNGDGFDDLIVGAYGVDSSGGDSGYSYVVFGGNCTCCMETRVGGDGNNTLTANQGAGAIIDILIGGCGNDSLIILASPQRMCGQAWKWFSSVLEDFCIVQDQV